jgi:hypothetical protein
MSRRLFSVSLVLLCSIAIGFFAYGFLEHPQPFLNTHVVQTEGATHAPTSSPPLTAALPSREVEQPPVMPSHDVTPTSPVSNGEAVALATSSSSPSVPTTQKSVLLNVPFSVQAPFGVWDAIHEETCEETAVMLVASFYDGEHGVISPKIADARILRIVEIERKLLGLYKDTSAEDTAAFAKKAYPNLTAQIISLRSIDDIKHLLQQGMPVILPADGKMLKNPNFKNGGPIYHMIVVIGYKNGYFITNDPGTRNGKSYLYKEDLLFAAAHDWNGGDVKHGQKVAIMLQPR